MRIYTLMALAVFVTFFFSGCKKDEATPSKKELLTSSPWKVTVWTSDPAFPNGAGATITDRFNQLQGCDKDDLFTFASNGNYTAEEGPSKCNPASPQVYTNGTWTLSTDEKTVSIIAGTTRVEYTLVSISKNELKITFNERDGVTSTIYKQSQTLVH